MNTNTDELPPPRFGRLLAAESASNFGSMLSRLAIPWLATLVLDATPFEMGLLLVADVAAGAVGAALLGSVVDRSEKRRVLVATDLLRAGLLAALAVAAALSRLNLALLLGAAALGGLLTVVFEMARSAWMAQRLSHDGLSRRNAQLSIAGSLSETAAFALGGFVYQGFGAVVALAIDAASYLASALCLRGVAPAPPVQAPAPTLAAPVPPWWHETRDGLAALRASGPMRRLAGIEGLMAMGGGLTGSCYMIFLARDLALSPAVIGVVAALGGLGAVLGGLLSHRLGHRWGSPLALAAGLATMALGAVCVPLAPALGAAAVVLLVLHQVVGDAGATVQEVHSRTLRQTRVGPALLARVDGGVRAVSQTGQLVGALGGGLFATWAGARAGLGLAALLLVLAAGLAGLAARRSD